ncbi:MAG: DUF4296 domain-containing protein [Bacteroidetes bacterium]|nr:DUF4296 domain-containing protein [Bacteroidota bacterium]MBV6461397.1 hypothetical protein [Flavobacteriales bacterium]WKZ75202.1 MAG: DUF4296 domain-containing protein [Vicingaceae bacterium]MCL4817425.1 DUF4296 domain-containing protein [Flavobacteriales bacterium]NOG96114.1 DUF4296 domain-containing protein [Bacteroidota bacterium]
MKIENIISALLLFCILSSCNIKEERILDEILNEEEMVALMSDMQLAEAIVKLQVNRVDSTSVFADSLFSQVFKKHNINKEKFKKNFDYYNSNPALMEEIYNKVIEKLSEEQAGLKGEMQREE